MSPRFGSGWMTSRRNSSASLACVGTPVQHTASEKMSLFPRGFLPQNPETANVTVGVAAVDAIAWQSWFAGRCLTRAVQLDTAPCPRTTAGGGDLHSTVRQVGKVR